MSRLVPALFCLTFALVASRSQAGSPSQAASLSQAASEGMCFSSVWAMSDATVDCGLDDEGCSQVEPAPVREPQGGPRCLAGGPSCERGQQPSGEAGQSPVASIQDTEQVTLPRRGTGTLSGPAPSPVIASETQRTVPPPTPPPRA